MNIDNKEALRLAAETAVRDVTMHHPDVLEYGAAWVSNKREAITIYIEFIRYHKGKPARHVSKATLPQSSVDKDNAWSYFVKVINRMMVAYEDGYTLDLDEGKI